MEIYGLDKIPIHTSYLINLDKDEAIQQCIAWNIAPQDTLEKNRALLRAFIKARKLNVVHSAKTEPGSGEGDSLTSSDDETPNKHDQEMKMSTNKTEASASRPPDQNRAEVYDLIKAMHSESMKMTMETVQQVVGALSAQQATTNKYNSSILSELLREIRPNGGTDPIQNIKFLLKVDSILESVPNTEGEVIPQILPYTKGKVREFWQKLGKQEMPWAQIISDFLIKFFTPDSIRQVKEEFLFRPQRQNEGLEDYVTSVRRSFKILSPDSAEPEIFQTIFYKITTETRTSLNSVGVMRSLKDIIDAAPAADAITKAANTAMPHMSNSSRFVEYTHTRNQGREPDRYRQSYGGPRSAPHNYARRSFTPRAPPLLHNPRPPPLRQYTPPHRYPQPQYPLQYAQHPQYALPYEQPRQQQPYTAFTPGYLDNSSQIEQTRQSNRGNLNSRRGH